MLSPTAPVTEKDFVERCIPLLRARFEGSELNVELRREVPVGRSIPDIVMLMRPNQSSGGSFPAAPLSAAESVLLACLRHFGPTRIDLLEKRAGLQRMDLRGKALHRIQAWGILERRAGGIVAHSVQWIENPEVIAIEAKLTRWKEALEQAAWHRQYVDRSYVLLPIQHAGVAIASTPTFVASGVGLLVAEADRITEAVPASQTEHHDWRREYLASRVLAVTS